MIIAVDLGGTNIRAGQVEENTILKTNQSLLLQKDSLSDTLSQLISVISPLVKPDVEGIGIGVPSIVDTERGIVYNVTNIPSWKKVELASILEKEFNLPVKINNDVNCFVLGEHLYGQAKPYSSVVALALGTGLGSGIIIHDKLYCGNNCGAGEIGSLPYLDKDFEFYTSSSFFEFICSRSAYEVHQAAKQNDTAALKAWSEYGLHLGNVIKAVIFTYDPEAIILGGSISKAYLFFEKTLFSSLSEFPFPESIKRLKILRSQTEHIALLGAAALIRNG